MTPDSYSLRYIEIEKNLQAAELTVRLSATEKSANNVQQTMSVNSSYKPLAKQEMRHLHTGNSCWDKTLIDTSYLSLSLPCFEIQKEEVIE